MKKVLLSLLTMIYMTVSSGMAMEIHICMGERTGTAFYTSSGETCGRCGMKEKKGGCCSDEQKFIKLSEDHKTSSAHYIVKDAVDRPAAKDFPFESILSFYKVSSRTRSFADSGPPLYIANGVLRI